MRRILLPLLLLASPAYAQPGSKPSSTCIVDVGVAGRLRTLPTAHTPGGETRAITGGGRDTVPLEALSPSTLPHYAAHQLWFTEGDTIRVRGQGFDALYFRASDAPEVLAPESLVPVGWMDTVPAFGLREGSAAFPDPVFVPVQPGCVFQRYQLGDPNAPVPPPSPAIVVPAAAPSPHVQIPVVYGTNRVRSSGRGQPRGYGNVPGPLEYGIVRVSVPLKHTYAKTERPSWFEEENALYHFVMKTPQPLRRDTALRRLNRMVARTRSKSLFVFVHGFNVSFEEAAHSAAQMAYDLRSENGPGVSFDGVPVLYSWPSMGEVSAYRRDEVQAQSSVQHLERFLRDVAASSGADKIHVIAHSMGNRALLGALQSIARTQSPRFNQVILAAPDVDAPVFMNSIAPAIRNAARRVTMYTSARDVALLASLAINQVQRAGMPGVPMPVAQGLETVDASLVLGGDFLGHSYFSSTPTVINDIVRQFAGQTSVAARGLKKRGRNGKYFYVISPF